MDNLKLLIPSSVDSDSSYWATVTQASPLRVKLDGEASSLPFTPDTLVKGLKVNDRVRVMFSTNNDPVFRGRGAIVVGCAGKGLVSQAAPGLWQAYGTANGADAMLEYAITDTPWSLVQRDGSGHIDGVDVSSVASTVTTHTSQIARTGCSLRRSTTQSIPNAGAGDTAISWNTQDVDTAGMWSSGATVTITSSGIWAVTVSIEYSAAVGTGRAYLGILVNGVDIYRLPYAGDGEVFITGSWTIPLGASDTFVTNVYQSSGAALNLTGELHCYRVGV